MPSKTGLDSANRIPWKTWIPSGISYGFVASDDVMRAVSLMLQNAIRETGSAEDFLGHIDTAVFVLVTMPDSCHKTGRIEYMVAWNDLWNISIRSRIVKNLPWIKSAWSLK